MKLFKKKNTEKLTKATLTRGVVSVDVELRSSGALVITHPNGNKQYISVDIERQKSERGISLSQIAEWNHGMVVMVVQIDNLERFKSGNPGPDEIAMPKHRFVTVTETPDLSGYVVPYYVNKDSFNNFISLKKVTM